MVHVAKEDMLSCVFLVATGVGEGRGGVGGKRGRLHTLFGVGWQI